MSFKPLGNRVLVREDETIKATISGILIPDGAAEKSLSGTIVAVSDDVEVKIDIGDTIKYGKYAGSEMTLDGEKFLIMNVDDILGKDT